MTENDEPLQCGHCNCYTAYQFHAETGRCRRYNLTTQLRTHCINHEHWKCKCQIQNCSEKIKHEKELNDNTHD